MAQIQIPNQWQPRLHQAPVWNYFADPNNSGQRAVLVWHRRAGKDSMAINLLASRAVQEVGLYWHMLPTAAQARKVIWNGIDGQGRRIIDQALPPEIRTQTRDDQMMIRLWNGSVIQLVGSDNYDSLVGTGTRGVVFSEAAIADPRAWDYIRPMLLENGGWAVFISTPRGRNWFYNLYHNAPDTWFAQRLSVEDTRREDGSRIFTDEMIEEERLSGMSEEMIAQEYYCSWEGGLEGAFYMREINDLREHRFGRYDPLPYTRAMTCWDLGVRDQTAIGIFHTLADGSPVLTDSIIDRNRGLDSYIAELRNHRYDFARHFAPHDIEQREFTTGKTRRALADSLGLYFDVTPNIPRHEGIEATRSFLRRLHVNDTPTNQIVLDHLAAYRREFDAQNNRYKDTPLHDYASDTADMIRYAALDFDPSFLSSDLERRKPKVRRAIR